MRFTKMHGAGNDYVYVDCFGQAAPVNPAELARLIADRHFGVGGDGLILIHPSDVADARMQMFNADGSEAEMCGNGVRCVAKYVHDHGIAAKPHLDIETAGGVLAIELEIVNGSAERARVDMGEPILDTDKIPVKLPRSAGENRILDLPLEKYVPLDPAAAWMEDCELDSRMTCVSMGNPHVVIYCGNVAGVPLENIGPFLEKQPVFPNRINVHFVEVDGEREVTMRTWERGSGITLACGTGACAVCVAGALTSRTARSILIHLPGGDLELDWADDNHVYMTGPAVEVFSGEWNGASTG